MAWQAQISKTERVGEKLNIIIHYQNDQGQAFDETIQVVNKPEDGALETAINNRLTALDALDSYDAELKHPDMQAKTFMVAPETTVTPAEAEQQVA